MSRSEALLEGSVAIVLAGGQGERLLPLTKHRSKPAVPFGGRYRIVDFTLSNCLNSGLFRIFVLTQYKSGSLARHIQLGWSPLFSAELDEWIFTVPPQLRVGQRWYEGTADAVFQNIYLLERQRPKRVLILSGDHIYKMDYRRLFEYHLKKGGPATVCAIEVPSSEASDFGILSVDKNHRILSFVEKPKDPPQVPGKPGVSLANMGVYLFETDALVRALCEDAANKESRHDFGHNILPALTASEPVHAFSFVDRDEKKQSYWRDVGTTEAYFEANMDLVSVDPQFNLYDEDWPLRTYSRQLGPAKTVFAQEEPGGRLGIALDSLLCGGVIVSGGRAERSILSPNVRINSYAVVEDSILMDGVDVGRHARVRRAIVDKGVKIPQHCEIGYDPDQDRRRFVVTKSGICVVNGEMTLE
jgi:glucose-1-phosphate adenylyltransferase